MENKNHEHDHDHGSDMVTIFINDKAIPVHRGSHTVAEIKHIGDVPSTDVLYQVPNYEVGLNDDDRITIHGNERFKSSAPHGGSS